MPTLNFKMPTLNFVPRTISLSFPGAVMVLTLIYLIVELTAAIAVHADTTTAAMFATAVFGIAGAFDDADMGAVRVFAFGATGIAGATTAFGIAGAGAAATAAAIKTAAGIVLIAVIIWNVVDHTATAAAAASAAFAAVYAAAADTAFAATDPIAVAAGVANIAFLKDILIITILIPIVVCFVYPFKGGILAGIYLLTALGDFMTALNGLRVSAPAPIAALNNNHTHSDRCTCT